MLEIVVFLVTNYWVELLLMAGVFMIFGLVIKLVEYEESWDKHHDRMSQIRRDIKKSRVQPTRRKEKHEEA